MARIQTYNSDVKVTGNDSWIGTDGDSFNRTKNFTPNKVANYLNSSEKIDRSNTITFTYQTLDPGESRSFGTISFDLVQPSYVAFSGITNILVSKRSNGLKYVDVFLSGTNETTIILQRGNSVNEYGLYNVTAIDDYIDDTNFFVFTLEFIQGNGGLNEDKEYLFSVVDFSKGVQIHNELEGLNDGDYIHLTQEEKEKFDELPNSFATNTSDLINDGSDGTSTYVETEELGAVAFSNDYNDLDNLPTIPTKTSDLINDSDFVSDANYVHTDNNFTNTLKSKLDGIQDGAEVNVNADWNATSGDAQILNKPTIPEAITNTSELINDGADGVNPFITLEDIPAPITIDAVPTDGSSNAVSSNGVFDALATKQNSLGFTPENVANKATNLTSPDNTKYPTTQAVVNGLATKQNTLTNPVTGTGANGQVAFWDGTNSQTGDNGLFWNNTNKRLGVGTNTPTRTLQVNGVTFISAGVQGNTNLDSAPLIVQNTLPYANPFNQFLQIWRNSAGSTILSLRADGSFDLQGTVNCGNIAASNNGNGTSVLTFYRSNNGIWFPNGNSLGINTNGSERMRIDSTGQVAIGATTAGARLDVRSQGALSTDIAFRVRNSADTANSFEVNGVGIKLNNVNYRESGVLSIFEKSNVGNLYFRSNTADIILNDFGFGNVIVGGPINNPSAKLSIHSTTQGFLPPRMTNAQRLAIASPAVGLMVYCTDATEGLYINKSTGWQFII
jgi:hypothetical protein